jgi:hypothetical protein
MGDVPAGSSDEERRVKVHVVVPALIARDPDVATLLRQRHEVLAERFATSLPSGWTWTQPQLQPRSDKMVFSVAQFAEASLRESVLATGVRGEGADVVSCRLDMMCVAIFRRTVTADGSLDYAALGALGDTVGRELGPDIKHVCREVACALEPASGSDDESIGLSAGVALWSHRVVEAPGTSTPPSGGVPVEVMPGLWIADGQTTVDTDLVDIDQVLIAIELATVHWLTIDTLNRKLFTRLTKLYDDSAGRSDTLETVYLQAVEAAGTVTAVEMLLEDQRQCLPTTARTIYSAYAEQWDLAGLRAALSRRASDIVDHDARRVDYLHAKQAQLTSDLLLVLTLATLIPAVLAVTDFVTNGEALDVHDGARVVVLVVTAVVVLAVILALRRMRAALPKATPRNATKGSASRD